MRELPYGAQLCSSDSHKTPAAPGHATAREPPSCPTTSTRPEPVHPGEILKHDFMKPFGLSSTALAKAIGVTPARINEIVRLRRGISAETALRLAKFFRTDARSWMNLQDQYELAVAERECADALRAIRPIAAA